MLQSGSSFSFLPQETEDDSDSAAADENPVDTVEEILKNPWQQTTQLPYDSSSDSNDYNEEGMDIDDAAGNADTLNKSTFQLKELFFFHADDPKLENRINGKLSLFIVVCFQSEEKASPPLCFYNGRDMPSRRSPNLPREVPECGGKMRRRRECTF